VTTTMEPPVSPEEYLLRERRAEYRSEYYEGEIVAMTGASRRHNLITGNAFFSIKRQLRGGGCEVYTSDMRVRIPATGAYLYPDLVIACGEIQMEDETVDTLVNPTVLMEVLSPSTERYDRGRKWELYRRIPSLQQYVLVSQDEPRIEWFTRQQGGLWLYAEAADSAAEVRLDSVGCTLRLADVYDGVL
jgi:Uma2 family endonuclease